MGAWKLDPTDTFTKSIKGIDRQLKGRLLDALVELSGAHPSSSAFQ